MYKKASANAYIYIDVWFSNSFLFFFSITHIINIFWYNDQVIILSIIVLGILCNVYQWTYMYSSISIVNQFVQEVVKWKKNVWKKWKMA